MGHSEFGQLLEQQASHANTVAGLRADVAYYKADRDRLQDEVVELRDQMETPQPEDCSTEEVMRNGALMTVLWQRHQRWGMPEVIGVYHGAYCLFAAHGDGDLAEAPKWAVYAMHAAVATLAREAA